MVNPLKLRSLELMKFNNIGLFMYTKKHWQFWLFVVCAWALFPLMAIWLMLTHPGKCAKIWNMEICGTWFRSV